jgi:hypothetical protein
MWALTRQRELPAINTRLISWQYLAWVWSVYRNFPSLSDKGIYRQWAGAIQNKGREAGKIRGGYTHSPPVRIARRQESRP